MSTLLKRLLLTSILLLSAFTGSASGDAGSMTLEQMVAASSIVVIGKVRAIHPITTDRHLVLSIAELEVQKVFKGPRNLHRLFYLATPTRACDVADASTGETGIYMMRNAGSLKARFGKYSSQDPSLQSVVGRNPTYSLIHFGRGRLTFTNYEGNPYIIGSRLSDSEIVFVGLPSKRYPDPEYPDVGLFAVDHVIGSIQNSLRGK